MLLTGDVVTLVGLVLDIIGVAGLFLWAPEKEPDPQWGMAFQIRQDTRDAWRQRQKRRRKIAGGCLGLIALGFALQGFAVICY